MDKKNKILYILFKSVTYDILFYYTLETMFLTLIKGFSLSEVFLISSVDLLFVTLLSFPINYLTRKLSILTKLRLGTLFFIIYFFAFMYINNFVLLCILVIFKSMGNQLVSVNSTNLLSAICQNDKENEVSKIEGRASAVWWILEAISAIIAGYLFEINPYISYYISSALLLFGFFVTFFIKIEKSNSSQQIKKIENDDIKKQNNISNNYLFKKLTITIILLAFSFWGAAEVFGSSAKFLIQDIGATSIITGWVYFGVKILTSTINVFSYKIEKKLSLKFLPISISIFFLSVLFMLLVYFLNISFEIKLAIMIISISLMYITRNPYRLNIKNTMTNFFKKEKLNTVYNLYFVAENLGGAIFAIIASFLTNNLNFGLSIIIILSIVLIILIPSIIQYINYSKKIKNFLQNND